MKKDNAIKLKAGQIWKAANGETVRISENTNDRSYRFHATLLTDEYNWYSITEDGKYLMGVYSGNDLVQLLQDAEEDSLQFKLLVLQKENAVLTCMLMKEGLL